MYDEPAEERTGDEAEQSVSSMPAPTSDAFAAVFSLLALVAEPKAFKVRLQGLHRALAAVDEGEKKLAADLAAFAAHEASVRAELEGEAAEIQKRRVAVHAAEMDLQIRENAVAAQRAETTAQDNSLKKRAAALAKMESPGPLQDPPSWPQLVAELAGAAHLETEPEPEFEGVTHTIEDAPAHLSVRRTMFQRKVPRSARRVEA